MCCVGAWRAACQREMTLQYADQGAAVCTAGAACPTIVVLPVRKCRMQGVPGETPQKLTRRILLMCMECCGVLWNRHFLEPRANT